MARREVSGGNTLDIKREIGKEYSGIYKGCKEIETKLGKQVIWQFINDDGVPFGIYGFSMLNKAMEAVPLENLCYVTYLGTKNVKTKYGMKDVHQVSVQIEVDEDAEFQKNPEEAEMVE